MRCALRGCVAPRASAEGKGALNDSFFEDLDVFVRFEEVDFIDFTFGSGLDAAVDLCHLIWIDVIKLRWSFGTVSLPSGL